MTSPRVIYLGIRTEKSANEVGGWSNVNQMGLRDGLIYDTTTRKFSHFTKSEVADLFAILQTADLVVGFNQLNFDYKVLSAYVDKDLETLPNFDMLTYIEQTLNFRVQRENLVKNTLGISKNEKTYINIKDKVEMTKKLFAHGCREGYLLYENKRFGGKDCCDTSSWAETAKSLSERNKFFAETMPLRENKFPENPHNSIPSVPTSPINPWKDKDEANTDSPFLTNHKHLEKTPYYSTADQADTENKLDIKEYQHIKERSEFEFSNTKESKKIQFLEEVRKTYDQSSRTSGWNAYDTTREKYGHIMSFNECMHEIGRLSNHQPLKINFPKRIMLIDRSGTLMSECVNDPSEIRIIKEELARGI